MCSDMISNFYLGLLHIITKWTCMHFAIWFKHWDWRVTLPHVTRKSLRTPLFWLESASPFFKQKCFWDIGGALIGMDMQLQTGESQACQDQLLTVTHSAISDTSCTWLYKYHHGTKLYRKISQVCCRLYYQTQCAWLAVPDTDSHMTRSTDTDSRMTYSKKIRLFINCMQPQAFPLIPVQLHELNIRD